jgi:uncharacterized protein YbbK (DUF523 family)
MAKIPRYTFLVSACLAGIPCTYKGDHKKTALIAGLVAGKTALAVCPELAAGLGVPRDRSEISGGDGADVLIKKARVITDKGCDLSKRYILSAHKIKNMAVRFGIKQAILRSKSPACGSGSIYDGTFTGKLRKGDGVLAAALKSAGITVHDERTGSKYLKKASV